MSITTFTQEICHHLEWDIQLRMKPESEEKLHALYRRGALTLTASNPVIEAFAVQTYAIALKSNSLGYFLGCSKPRFPLRALWLMNKADEDPELMIQWIIGCGFNCVLGNALPADLLEAYGLRGREVSSLEATVPGHYETHKEALAAQISKIEANKRESLFYIAPGLFADGQEEWLHLVLDDMGLGSWLAVEAGHPFWGKLSEIPDASSTPLAMVGTPDQHIKDPFMATGMQKLSGGVVKIELWPKENSLESRNLWAAGQSLWWNLPPGVLIQAWDKVFMVG